MGGKDDKTVTKKLGLFKGGRKRDIYEDAKWKKRANKLLHLTGNSLTLIASR